MVTTDSSTLNQVSTSSTTFSFNPPTVTGLSYTNAPTTGGGNITIAGSNFGTLATVTIGSRACNVTSQGHTQLVCVMGPGQGGGLGVQVTVSGQTVLAAQTFAYSPPVISSITPNTGDPGITVTIIGFNFGTNFSATGSQVTIGGNVCPFSVANHTYIVCTVRFCLQRTSSVAELFAQVPSGSGSNQPVNVQAAQQFDSSGITFTYTPPSITSISATSFPTAGGVNLTIRVSRIAAPNSRPGFTFILVRLRESS